MRKILVVEDDYEIANAIKEYLTEKKYLVYNTAYKCITLIFSPNGYRFSTRTYLAKIKIVVSI